MNVLKPVCITLISLLTACTTPHRTALETQPPAPPTPVAKQEPPSIKTTEATSLSSWELSGALAAKNKNKGWTASLNWQQKGANRYQIRLFGPLGGGTVLIEKEGSIITYRDGPKIVTSTDADALLQKETGVRLPVKNLYYWIRGLAAPGAVKSAQYDENHHLTTLKQAGYTIEYTRYTQAGNMTLPSKIHLTGHNVVIKLVIKHWGV